MYADFNLYYFAGALERNGSYTDTDGVFRLMSEAGLPVPTEGVYGTPSLVALVFQPFSLLPLSVAQTLWMGLCVVGLLVATRWAVPNRYWPLALVPLLLTPAALLGIRLGNFSVMTTILLLVAFGSARRKRPKVLGVSLGLAIAFKLFPGLLVVVLLAKRQWKALFWCSGTCAALTVATVAALGFDDAVKAYDVSFGLGNFVHLGFDNVSLPAWVQHSFDSEPAPRIASLALLAITAALIFVSRRAPLHQVFALGVSLMLLSQAIAWRHYTPILVIALLCLIEGAKSRLTVGLGLLSFLLATGCVSRAIEDPRFITYFTTTTYTLGILSLALLQLVAINRASKPKNVTGRDGSPEMAAI